MPISKVQAMGYAVNAMNRVKTQWTSWIPNQYSAVSTDQVFIFHANEAGLRQYFNPVYDSLFKPANNLTVPAAQFPAPAGFVTPDLSTRKIHVNIGGNEYDWVALFAHEFVHWLSDVAFYPRFYASEPGRSPELVEGATEYATLKCFSGHADALTGMQTYRAACLSRNVPKLKKSERSAYPNEYVGTKQWIKLNPGNEQLVLNFMFRGVVPAGRWGYM